MKLINPPKMHKSICDEALAHYLEMVLKLSRYNTTVPLAIAFYREHYKPGEPNA